MLSIDTEAIKQMVTLVQSANEEIDSAAEQMQRITSHSDWGCRERVQINEAISNCRNNIKVLQDSGRSFFGAIKQVLDEFTAEENNISQLFQSVEGLLSKVLSAGSAGAVLFSKGTSAIMSGRGLSGIISSANSTMPVVAEKSPASVISESFDWSKISTKPLLFPDGSNTNAIVPINIDMENLGDALSVVDFETIAANFDVAH